MLGTKKHVGRFGRSIRIVWWGQNMSIYYTKATKQMTPKAKTFPSSGNKLHIPRRNPCEASSLPKGLVAS